MSSEPRSKDELPDADERLAGKTPAPSPPGAGQSPTDQMLAALYEELRSLAQRAMAAEPVGHTLQPTALVHEAYLRLARGTGGQWDNRAHFMASAAEAMRRILIEHARRVQRQKRGGGWHRVTLDHADSGTELDLEQFLAIEDALVALETRYPEKAKVVKLRFFAGLTSAEVAVALGANEGVIHRHWRFARAWLRSEMDRVAR
ncbi:MAG: sigma-70 family RNA polymerase sigma factor [Planctomycetota bacterium]